MPAAARRLALLVLTAVAVGAFTVTLNLSVAAIIYQGDLARFIDRGIALTLLGTVPMALLGTFVLGYRGTICQPQDAPAIVLSLAAGTIAVLPGERAFATTAALVVVTSLASGLCAWLLGRHAPRVRRTLIPYPVLGGFIAATGYLLVAGGLGIAIGAPVELGHLGPSSRRATSLRWLPWAIGAALLTALLRRTPNPLLLPVGLIVAAGVFYLVLAVAGLGIDEARATGLLLGPFPAGRLPAVARAAGSPRAIDWGMIVEHVPAILAIVGLTAATALLSAAALEVVTGERIDPDSDLRGIGLCNLAGAFGGASVGYHVLSTTMIAKTTGSRGRANGLIAGGASLLALFVGAQAIAVLPVGLFALLILVIGFSMLLEALVDHRRSLRPSDYVVVLHDPGGYRHDRVPLGCRGRDPRGGAASSCSRFARVDPVRLETTVARMRSRVERSEADQAWLEATAARRAVYVLAGYVFFGTAQRLVSRIEAALAIAIRGRASS